MKLNIAVLPGDGIGPEIIQQTLLVTIAIAKKFNHTLHYEYGICGGEAIEQVGNPYPDSTHELCLKSDAILFGAIGHPKYDNNPSATIRPEQGLLAMRKQLKLYANIRPINTFPCLLDKSPLKREVIEGVDFMCIRELTGGVYFGRPQGRSEDGNTAYDTCVYHHIEIERIVNLAYQYAMQRRKKLTVVDKANVLATSRLWRETAKKISTQYPEVETEFMFVDNAAMRIIQFPNSFDVIVTENMFGDILTDEASVITGSLGLLPSASIGIHTSLYEPIHGSYTQAAGKNIANPLATILSVAMMFEYTFKLPKEGALIRQAVEASIKDNIRTEDIQISSLKPYTTSEVGQWIIDYIVHI
ncbi:MAG: 3-isopropylmalate dehydrogenase [Chitinophagaceae bacterium]